LGSPPKQLGVSEPALSRSLTQLETELGVRLFDRQGVAPTLLGEIVLKHGERAVTEFAELMRELTLAKGLEIGELRIAAAPLCSDISGQHAIGIVSDRHPNLLIQFSVADGTSVVEDVRGARVDLGFAEVSEAERDPDFDVETIGASPDVFFCRAGHPLTRQERITFDDLLDDPLVGPSYPSRAIAGRLRHCGASAWSTGSRSASIRAFSSRPSTQLGVSCSPAPPSRGRSLARSSGSLGGAFHRPACRGVLAQGQLRLHNQTRPHALARIDRFRGDRPGDRKRDSAVGAFVPMGSHSVQPIHRETSNLPYSGPRGEFGRLRVGSSEASPSAMKPISRSQKE
jgi:DNA-binding transcriptional LysR family regulator